MLKPVSPQAHQSAEVGRLLREYDLGGVISSQTLAGGSAAVLRITARHGSFVLKAAGRPADVELQASVTLFLSNRGIRQGRILPTRASPRGRDGPTARSIRRNPAGSPARPCPRPARRGLIMLTAMSRRPQVVPDVQLPSIEGEPPLDQPPAVTALSSSSDSRMK
jgi:hypothetical protein